MDMKTKLTELIAASENTELLEKIALALESNSAAKLAENESNAAKSAELKYEKICGAVSYELGSPLNSLKSIAELLIGDLQHGDNPVAEDTANYLWSQLEILQGKMANLILWSDLAVKNYSAKPTGLNCIKTIEKEIAELHKQAENKGVSISLQAEKEVHLYADPKMFQMIVRNLLINSVKFCRRDDSVKITAETMDGTVLLTFSDTGIGMSPAKLMNVFDPSRKSTQRGTANESGLGFGLPLIKELTEINSGTLEAESVRGEGSVFRLTFPSA